MNQIINYTRVKITFVSLLTFFSFYHGFGQNKIGAAVVKFQQENTRFTPISLLSTDKEISSKDIDKAVTGATLAKVDLTRLNEMALNPLDYVELEIPYQNQNIKILLYRIDPFASDFQYLGTVAAVRMRAGDRAGGTG